MRGMREVMRKTHKSWLSIRCSTVAKSMGNIYMYIDTAGKTKVKWKILIKKIFNLSSSLMMNTSIHFYIGRHKWPHLTFLIFHLYHIHYNGTSYLWTSLSLDVNRLLIYFKSLYALENPAFIVWKAFSVYGFFLFLEVYRKWTFFIIIMQ